MNQPTLKPSSFRIRLLPLTILGAFMLLTIRIADVVEDMRVIEFGVLHAADTTPATEKKAIDPKRQVPETDGGSLFQGFEDLLEKSPEESKLLLDLMGKSDSLDEKQKTLELKDKLVRAATAKIDTAASEAEKKAQDEENAALVGQKDKKPDPMDEEYKRLSKIYQNMKPDQAAKILEEMPSQDSLSILSHMSAGKSAAILAAMPPEKAKDISELGIKQVAEKVQMEKMKEQEL